MDHEPRVSDLAAEEEPTARPAWLLPLVVGLGGFALGVLVATTVASSDPSEVTPTFPPRPAQAVTSPSTSGPVTTTTLVDVIGDLSNTDPLEDLVPGFTGTLYFGSHSYSSFEGTGLLMWPSDSSNPIESGIGAGFGLFDQSGTRLASMSVAFRTVVVESAPLFVYGGLDGSGPASPEDQVLVSVGATGFAWHATEPGLLAWIEQEGEGRWTLKTADFSEALATPRIVRDFSEPMSISYWDDQVIVVSALDQTPDDAPDGVRFLSPNNWMALSPFGELLGEAGDGRVFLGATADGELVVGQPDVGAETATTYLTDFAFTDQRSPDWLESDQVIIRAAPSPAGSRTLFHTLELGSSVVSRSVLIVDNDERVACGIPTEVGSAFWSIDGQWLVAHSNSPRESGLWFTRIEPCESYWVPLSADEWSLTAVGR